MIYSRNYSKRKVRTSLGRYLIFVLSLSICLTQFGQNAMASGTATATLNVTAVESDLSLTISHSGDFTQGQTATYMILIHNGGSGPTNGTTTVTNTLPTGLTFTGFTGISWSCSAAGQAVTCTSSDQILAGSDFPAITLTVNVADSAPPTITNEAQVSGGGELNTADNTAIDEANVIQLVDLSISASHIGDFGQGQQGAAYQLTVTNGGLEAGHGTITLVDTLPQGLTYVSGTGTDWTCSYDTSSRTVTCNRNAFPPGVANATSIMITVNVAADAEPTLTNTAEVSGGGDYSPANNSTSDPTTVTPVVSLTTSSIPSGQIGRTYNQSITAFGGAGSPYTFSLISGSLPNGLTLNATGMISGRPTAGGIFNFTVRAADINSNADLEAYSLTITSPTIVLTSASPPAPQVGSAYNQTLSGSGGTIPYGFIVTSGNLPAGLTLSSSGQLSGTPTAAGTYNFTVTATDSSTGNGPFTGSRAYSFTITATPTVSTSAASEVSTTKATIQGDVAQDGGSAVAERGFVYSTQSSPTVSDSKLTDSGTGTGTYNGQLNNLNPATIYYVRAYAVNAAGVNYGNEIQFTTQPALVNLIFVGTANSSPPALPPVQKQTESTFSGIVNLQSLIDAIKNALVSNRQVSFQDAGSHWGRNEITLAARLGIVDGYTDGTIQPDAPVTRAEFSAMLVRAFYLTPGSGSMTFTDTQGNWAQSFVQTLASNGIITGYGDRTFMPSQNISRAEMMQIISKILNLKQLKTNSGMSFLDVTPQYWAKVVIDDAAAVGIIQGEDDVHFAPEKNATRAESLTIILRALKTNPTIKSLLDTGK